MSDLEQMAIERLKAASCQERVQTAGRKGLQMHREYADLQGPEGVHVEPDSPKAHAAYPAGAVLLLRPERNGRGRAVHLHGGSLG